MPITMVRDRIDGSARTSQISRMYRQSTHGFTITAEPFYIAEQSDEEAGRHFWAYRITIENHSNAAARLMSRHWLITDAAGRTQEVQGDGVVGEQPVLGPGDSYQYTSGCPLDARSGVMQGSYTMKRADGVTFDVQIPAFSLDIPGERRAVN